MLFAHNYDQLPVAKGRDLRRVGSTTVASFDWVKGDDFAGRVKNVFEQGMLAASIGFRPTESEPIKTGGVRFTSWELLEFSLVPVPANPDAHKVMRSMGLLPAEETIELDCTMDELVEAVTRRVNVHSKANIESMIKAELAKAVPDILRTAWRAGMSQAYGRIDDTGFPMFGDGRVRR